MHPLLFKRGGTSLAQYMKTVAEKYGMEFKAIEWIAADEPGDTVSDKATFYVTHLREPVDRAISHFKCRFYELRITFKMYNHVKTLLCCIF